MSNQTESRSGGRPKKRSMAGTRVSSNPGRPRKLDMHDVSYSTLNRRAHEIAEQFDIATIQLALNIAKKNANVIDTIDGDDDIDSSTVIPHTLESAFAFFLENDFSKAQWDRLVHDSKKQNAPIYPSYYMLDKIKKEIRPTEFSVENEICVQLPFQVMLNKTAERLVTAVGLNWSSIDLGDLVLLCTYGFDSSSGLKNPHQRFDQSDNITLKSEQSLFASTFTVIGLVAGSSNTRLWLNPTPQSTRFCRPLRLAIEKETDETITIENDRLQKEVEKLHPFSFILPNQTPVTVQFQVYFTMIDGKILNSVLHNSATTRCPVCSLTMDQFNQDCDWKSNVPPSHLKHGIANLHCEIKTMEQLIKLSCRLPLQTWTIRNEMKRK